jgi:hypothetical protein
VLINTAYPLAIKNGTSQMTMLQGHASNTCQKKKERKKKAHVLRLAQQGLASIHTLLLNCERRLAKNVASSVVAPWADSQEFIFTGFFASDITSSFRTLLKTLIYPPLEIYSYM